MRTAAVNSSSTATAANHAPAPRPAPLPAPRGLLRFSTAGSVDDGKSTLIGRLLYDSKSLFEDQLAQVERATKRLRRSTAGLQIDLSLLTDGLIAEREQGITIDVAYRYFATPKRKFIIADTPGHEQYTRNMVTGASTADLAIVLVDARNGLSTQSRRHALIARLLGIRHLVLAVNKMDLVHYAQDVFTRIAAEFDAFIHNPLLPGTAPAVQAIPLSALRGDNVVDRSPNMPWYRGAPLLDLLESVDVSAALAEQPFRFPVQLVSRPQHAASIAMHDFRGYQGRITSGRVQVGDAVTIAPHGRASRVKDIVVFERGQLQSRTSAQAPASITLLLEDDMDISRGDLIAGTTGKPMSSRELRAVLCWMDAEPLDPSRKYLLKLGAATVAAKVTSVDARIDVQTGAQVDTSTHGAAATTGGAATLGLNDIGIARIRAQQALAFDLYRDQRATGGFILIDAFSHQTVAAGMIHG